VLINLVENAIKYSPQKTQIQVALQEDEGSVYLIVADNGIGIADDDKTKVFTKFYRVGNEDTRKTKGTGLGLYIVKRFMEIYSGQIELKDNSPQGTIFTLRFPKKGL
jgi:two-component system phosphate regulon sensor histidine kinase PhoR